MQGGIDHTFSSSPLLSAPLTFSLAAHDDSLGLQIGCIRPYSSATWHPVAQKWISLPPLKNVVTYRQSAPSAQTEAGQMEERETAPMGEGEGCAFI